MALFKLFGKKEEHKRPKGYHLVPIKKIERFNDTSVKVILDIKASQDEVFKFIPGQYLNFAIRIEGEEYIRSYSICSGKDEFIAIGVKETANGTVSTWFNRYAKEGDQILVAAPHGNFTRPADALKIVAFAAGSGITPVLSILKDLDVKNGTAHLFFGNRTEDSIMFRNEIDALKSVQTLHYLSGEEKENFGCGRIDKETTSAIIRNDLSLLKADAFFICGPELMIVEVRDKLKLFGIPDHKIHLELFTTPVLLQGDEEKKESDFKGISKVHVTFDKEEISFELKADGATILDKAIDGGLDAPYSCRGGVCCTCKAKVLKGEATMKINYSLTDDEVKNGYILTCQAHPASAELIVTYDE